MNNYLIYFNLFRIEKTIIDSLYNLFVLLIDILYIIKIPFI